jgi:hypothetical protein
MLLKSWTSVDLYIYAKMLIVSESHQFYAQQKREYEDKENALVIQKISYDKLIIKIM